jgi:hypothetical protein
MDVLPIQNLKIPKNVEPERIYDTKSRDIEKLPNGQLLFEKKSDQSNPPYFLLCHHHKLILINLSSK